MNLLLVSLLLLVLVNLIVVRHLKISQEHERFAVFRVGRYVGLRGPGLCLNVSGPVLEKWHRISLDDRGELISPDNAKFDTDIILPVKCKQGKVGGNVRIVGFDENLIHVMTVQDD